MKLYRLSVLFALYLFVGLNAYAQTTYTLNQCVEFALKNHRSIKIASNDVQVAYARKKEGQSAYLPQVNAQVRWDDNLQLQKTVIPPISLGAITTPEQTVQFGQQYNTLIGVQLDQFLYNKSFIDGIRAIKPSYELAELKKEKTEEDVIYNTVAAYYQILLIQEQEKLLKLNESRIRKTLPIVKLQYEKGVAKKVDADRVQVSLNNLIAQADMLRMNKELAYNNLKHTMALPLDEAISIDTNYAKEIIDIHTFSDTSNLKNKVELRLLRKNLQLQNVLLKRTAAAYFPVLSFTAKYAGQTFGNQFGPSFRNWSQFSMIGFKLDIPIFDGLRTASAIKQSKLNLESLKENISITEEGLKLQLINAQVQYSNAVSTIDVNKTNLDLAKSILDVVTLQFEKGVISYTDLLAAETSYKEAELNYISSFVSLLNAKLEIDKANGTLKNYASN